MIALTNFTFNKADFVCGFFFIEKVNCVDIYEAKKNYHNAFRLKKWFFFVAETVKRDVKNNKNKLNLGFVNFYTEEREYWYNLCEKEKKWYKITINNFSAFPNEPQFIMYIIILFVYIYILYILYYYCCVVALLYAYISPSNVAPKKSCLQPGRKLVLYYSDCYRVDALLFTK